MNPNPSEGYVRVERRGTVSHIEFFHPQSNSLPSELLAALANSISDEGHDPAVHVIVLRSGGDRVFCGGASFTELASIRTEAQGLAFFSGFAHVINAIRTVPKFVSDACRARLWAEGLDWPQPQTTASRPSTPRSS